MLFGSKKRSTLLSVVGAFAGYQLLPSISTQAQFISPKTGVNAKTTTSHLFSTIVSGESGQINVSIVNPTEEETIVTLQTADLKVTENGVVQSVSADEAGVSSWVDLPTDTINLPKNNEVVLQANINVPPDTLSGEYGYAISMQTTPAQTEGVATQVKNNLRGFVVVPGDLELKADIAKLNLIDPGDSVFRSEQVNNKKFGRDNMFLDFMADNRGNVFSILEASYTLKLPTGQEEKGTFKRELVPRVGGRRFTAELTQPYQEGTTEIEVRYNLAPLNSQEAKFAIQKEVVLQDSITLSQTDLDKFSTSSEGQLKGRVAAVTKPQSTDFWTQLLQVNTVISFLLGAIVIFAGVQLIKKRQKKLTKKQRSD